MWEIPIGDKSFIRREVCSICPEFLKVALIKQSVGKWIKDERKNQTAGKINWTVRIDE